MLNTGRNPVNPRAIEDVLTDETTEDAAILRPMLVQLRAAADRPIPVPSAALQLLLDGAAPGAAGVTQLDALRSRREAKGEARYGAKRRTAATSLAVVMFLGAGTGVAAAVDGGVRQQIVASVAKVGTVLAPQTQAPAEVAPEEAAPEVPAALVPASAPVPVEAPAVPARVEVQPSPAAVEAPAVADAVPGKSGEAGGSAVDTYKGTGKAEVKVPVVSETPRGNGNSNSQGQGAGAVAKGDGWVPPGQAKKSEEASGKSSKTKASDLLKGRWGR